LEVKLIPSIITIGEPLRIELFNLEPSKNIKVLFSIKDATGSTLLNTEETYFNTGTNPLAKIIYTNPSTPTGSYKLLTTVDDEIATNEFTINEPVARIEQIKPEESKTTNKISNLAEIILLISALFISIGLIVNALKSQVIHRE
jgi:hypothetical protein